MNPHQVTKDFERELCKYTGAKFAVTTTSCTMALLLACSWHFEYRRTLSFEKDTFAILDTITIPSRTYVGVPMSIIHAGFNVEFEDVTWVGRYRLKPLPIWDSARWFTSNMYMEGEFQCVSFHWSKHLAIGQGGAILHDSEEADEWLRMMRFDGRQEGVNPSEQKEWVKGYHAYMSPRDAADGLSRLAVLPEHNGPLPNDDYPDLREIFK